MVQYKVLPQNQGYRVGDDGSVWSRKNGRWGFRKSWRKLNPGTLKNGHKIVVLSFASKGTQSLYVHRLVLEAFVGPCPEGMECCHEDGNPGNNKRSNLRWDTHYNNMEDRRKHGTLSEGARIGTSKLTSIQAKAARVRLILGHDKKVIAASLGVGPGCIDDIGSRKTWNCV